MVKEALSSSRNHGLIPCAKKHKTDFELRVSYQVSVISYQEVGVEPLQATSVWEVGDRKQLLSTFSF
jgi:hypothetical protein